MRSLRALDGLNFLLADVQTGVGPFLAIYLAGHGWNEQRVGIALMVGGIAGILLQTPAGALVDALRSKRALIGVGVTALASGALVIALFPSLWLLSGVRRAGVDRAVTDLIHGSARLPTSACMDDAGSGSPGTRASEREIQRPMGL